MLDFVGRAAMTVAWASAVWLIFMNPVIGLLTVGIVGGIVVSLVCALVIAERENGE